jgi:hypothetical protein
LKNIWQEVVVACLKVLSQHLGNNEKIKKSEQQRSKAKTRRRVCVPKTNKKYEPLSYSSKSKVKLSRYRPEQAHGDPVG